jgi:hypothetical protein
VEISCAFPPGPDVVEHAVLAESLGDTPMGPDVPRELRAFAAMAGFAG